MTEPLPPGGTVPDADELHARWADAWAPEQAAERLGGVGAPWCIAAGWALDLFRGESSRPHGDLEIAVPAAGFPEIRDRFPEYTWDAVGWGRVWAGAGAEALAATYQTWLRDPVSGRFLFDVFREPHEGMTWVCSAGRESAAAVRRDHRADGGRDPLSDTGVGAAVQGEGDPAQGPGGLRRRASVAGPGAAGPPRRVAGPGASRTPVAGGAGPAVMRGVVHPSARPSGRSRVQF